MRPDHRHANQTRLACNEGKKSSPPLKFLTALKVEMFMSGTLGMESWSCIVQAMEAT